MINASGENGVKMKIRPVPPRVGCSELPYKWKTSVIVPIFKGVGNVISLGLF